MDGVFSGVSTDDIEKFFASMIVFDVSMPHTNTRLSPITFADFMTRNNIMCLNQNQVYDAACKFWQRYLSFTPNVLTQCQKPMDMNICEQEHPGWNKLIDFLNRCLDVQKFDKNPMYQMHYLAHVSYLFHSQEYKNEEDKRCQFTIFQEIVKPVTYDTLIPTNYNWLPVLNFADMRFAERLALMQSKASAFIESHCARTMNHQQYDQQHLIVLRSIVNEGLVGIHHNKYNDDEWKKNLLSCISKSSIIKADLEVCELHDSFERDGMRCMAVLNQMNKIKKHFENQNYSGDPDLAIDELLDAYSIVNNGLKSYNIPVDKLEAKS